MRSNKLVVKTSLLLLMTLLIYNILRPYIIKAKDTGSNKIIVIFHEEIETEELREYMSSMDSAITVEKHIGDYALISVNKKPLDILSRLQREPMIRTAELNQEIAIFSHSKDAYSITQWAIDNPGYYPYLYETGYEMMESTLDVDLDVIEAWEYTINNQGAMREVVVAIIDTGVDYTHPDLAKQMWTNTGEIPGDDIDNDGNGYIDDVYGWDFYNDDSTVCHYEYIEETEEVKAKYKDNDDHGTHIAGIISAVANNNIGVAGIASNVDVKIMSLKINGGKDGVGEISSAIEAIKYATLMGADICNISWGTEQYNKALEQVIKDSNALFVTAAGNDGNNNNNTPIYPAGYELDNLVSVTFVDPKGELTEFSNYGAATVDIAAPGVDIFSTIVGDYGYMSGSSMAAPHVTAIAAMLYSYKDNLYASNVKDVIMDSLKPLVTLEGLMINPGIPSAYKAILDREKLVDDSNAPRLSFDKVFNNNKFEINIEAIDRGESGIRTIRWFYGKRKKSDFKNGTAGTRVNEGVATISKAGVYTFYCSDYAGNDMIIVYNIEDDTNPPMIIPGYTVADDYKTMEVKVRVIDALSGVKRVKYMPGKKEVSDFLPQGAGEDLILTKRMGGFKVDQEDYYTIYAIDNRGNHTVYHLNVEIVKAENIKFIRTTETLQVNERYNLRAFIRPVNTTDQVLYQSLDPTVAIVSKRGEVHALKEGTTVIEARTSGGLRVNCTIIVTDVNTNAAY